MKNLIILLFCAAGFAISCDKEKGPNGPVIEPPIDTIDTIEVNPDTTWASIFRNGNPWNNLHFKAESGLKFDPLLKDVCLLTFYDLHPNLPFVRNWLDMSSVPIQPGTYNLKTHIPSLGVPGIWVDYSIWDGDQPEDKYFPDTTKTDNYIEITRYDSITHFIEGNFNLSLALEGQLTGANNPTYQEFKNCSFRMKLEF